MSRLSGVTKLSPVVSGATTHVEAEARPDPARTTPPLLQVSLGRPHRGVVSHVVVGREQLHLGFTRVHHVHNIVDGYTRLRYVGR